MIAAMLSVICVVESAVADEDGSAAAELARLDALALADEYNEESLLLDATALDELVAAFVVVANLIVDILYAVLDPRVRLY